MPHAVILPIVIAMLPAVVMALGLEPVGREFRVNESAISSSGFHIAPAVCMQADGSFVVAWTGNDDDLSGVFARQYDRSDRPAGEFLVNSMTEGQQEDAAICCHPNGGFVVVWASHDQDGWAWGVFGQRYDRSGNRLAGEFQVNTFTDQSQLQPSVACRAAGEFLATWTSTDQFGSECGWRLVAREFGPSTAGDEFLLIPFEGCADLENSRVAALRTGGYVVVTTTNNADVGILVQRISESAQPAGEYFVANSASQREFQADVCGSSSGTFVAAWDGSFLASALEDEGGVWTRRFLEDGPADLERPIELEESPRSVPRSPAVACDPEAGFIASWVRDLGVSESQVLAQHFNETQEAAGLEVIVGGGGAPAIAFANETTVVVWQRGSNLFARRLALDDGVGGGSGGHGCAIAPGHEGSGRILACFFLAGLFLLRRARMGLIFCALAVGVSASVSQANATNRVVYVPVHAPSALTVLDTATQTQVGTILLNNAGGYGPTDIATSPAASTAFIAHDCQVALVDTATDSVRAEVAPPRTLCAERVASNFEATLAVVTDSSEPILWVIDATAARITGQYSVGFDEISSLTVTPDGAETILTVSRESQDGESQYYFIVAIDTATGAVLRQRQLSVIESGIALSPDGATVYVGDARRQSVVVLDRMTFETVRVVLLDEPPAHIGSAYSVQGLTIAPDGTFAVVVLNEPTNSVIHIRDASTGTLLRRVRIDAPAGRPAVDPDTGLIYVPIRDALGRLAVIDPLSGNVVQTVAVGEDPIAVAVGPSRPTAPPTPTVPPTPIRPHPPLQLCAYVAHPATKDAAGALTVINARQNAFSRWFPIGMAPTNPHRPFDGAGANGVALSVDGLSIFVTTTNTVLVMDSASGIIRNRIPVGAGAGAIAVRPDGAVAYVGKSNSIGVIDLSSEMMTDAFFTNGSPKDIAFTPDGDLAYVSRTWDSDSVLVVDAREHALIQTIPVWEGPRYTYTERGNHVAVAPDGRSAYVAVDHADSDVPSTVARVDRETHSVGAVWSLPLAGAPNGIAVHPDGTRLYVAIDPRYSCRDDPITGACVYRHNVIAVLDSESGDVLATVPVRGRPTELAASPDGTVLYATDSEHGVVTVIDLNNYATLASITTAGTPDFFVADRVAIGLVSGGCPIQNPIQPLPTRTFTSTRPRSPSPTPTPTNSIQPTPTPKGCAGTCAVVELSHIRARQGERVEMEARLRSGGRAVAFVLNRIEWDPAVPIPELLELEPDCVADGSDGDAAFGFGPSYFYDGYGPFACWPGYDCGYVEARAAASAPGGFPDGTVLYRCTVDVAPDAEPGRHLLHLRGLNVRGESGEPIAAVAVDGVVVVRERTGSQSAPSSQSGCSINVRHTDRIWPLFPMVAAAFVVSLLRRRQMQRRSR